MLRAHQVNARRR